MFKEKINVAVGRHRKETAWKNKIFSWPEFVKKLSETHRTAETVKEYAAATKDRQAEIKDVGGFVGGHITGGRRLASRVLTRSLITLDVDFCDADFWDGFTMLYDLEAVVYSTHKHTPESPRLRLIVPLNREVMADEYQAISRRLAGSLDIEAFDPTTFQPERLMYWPSTPRDGEYFFEHQAGEPLDADAFLASYPDWRNAIDWPISEKVQASIVRGATKQGDPLEKPGIVGAFCRAYDIHEAIAKFLSDEYEQVTGTDRYTYLKGSTAAGLVTYDNKFAYSHHGTDPTSGQLCNAFDIVRLHKYGRMDEDSPAGTPINKRPSYLAFCDFAAADDAVKRIIIAEKIDDFKDIDVTDPPPAPGEEVDDPDWQTKLEIDKKGNFLSTIDNISIILNHDPRLKNNLTFDEFESRLIATRDLPWRKIKGAEDWTDDDCDCLAHYLECYKMPFVHINKALAKVRNDRKIHPVREYLKKLKWDRKPRIATLFIDFLGAEDCPYIRAVAVKTLTAAVTRVFEPGCKFDNVPVLVGEEGVGKSTLWAKLFGRWFSDCLGDVNETSGMESLRGVWGVEIAELAALRKADQEAIKRFITSREDIYRPAYGRLSVRHPRQNIFVASTNEDDFLQAGHGNRRFWPVRTNPEQATKDIFSSDFSPETVAQYWAEACALYVEGEDLILGPQLEEEARKQREAHTKQDSREGMIDEYLLKLLPDNWDTLNLYERRAHLYDNELSAEGTKERTVVSAAEIWCEVFSGHLRDMTNLNVKPIHDYMKKRRDWVVGGTVKRGFYGRQRCYVKVGSFHHVRR